MAPMKLYGWVVSPWMARVLVCLEEAGAEYEVVRMSRSGGDHRRPEHLARNPFGEIPVLENGDLTLYRSAISSLWLVGIGRGNRRFPFPSINQFHSKTCRTSWEFPAHGTTGNNRGNNWEQQGVESRAIARYILRKYKPELLGDGDLKQSATVDVWVEVESHQLEPVVKTIVVHCILAPYVGLKRDQAVVDENLGKLRALLPVYEARLTACRYLAGDEVTAADLCHFGFMRYFMATEYAGVVDEYPHVKAWWDALLARPSVKKVIVGMPPDFGFGSGNIP